MMSERITQQAGALAVYLHHLQPKWDVPGIGKALLRAAESRVWQLVETAALKAARDPQALTPAAIEWERWYPQRGQLTGYPLSGRRCPTCPGWVVEGAPHHCKPGDPVAGVVRVRAAIERKV